MTDFLLERFCDSDMGTFGRLTSEGFACYTLEQPWRNNQQGHSCIPTGAYTCRRGHFPKHGEVFEVMNVQDRTAILIHEGNIAGNFEGCIGVGDSLGVVDNQWAILNSRKTLADFMAHLAGIDEFRLTVQWRAH